MSDGPVPDEALRAPDPSRADAGARRDEGPAAPQSAAASIVLVLAEALFPRDVARSARRAGVVCLVLAVTVAVLFPVSGYAGTEVPAARWTTTGALGLAWLLLRRTHGRLTQVGAGLLALVTGAVVAPAPWLVWLAAIAAAYVATAFLPRPGPAHRAAARPRPEARAARFAAGGGAAYAAHALGEALVGHDDDTPPLEALQEVLESVGMALVLALVVREFGFEAFKIPTDSMKPTILGDTIQGRKGDRLLAFKPTTYRRYDIVVFRFPLFRGTNYIKRLIGLPGERLEIRDGDVYADGKVAPKPDDVQKVMWKPVLRGEAEDWTIHFDAEDDAAWRFGAGSAQVDATAAASPSAPVAWTQVRRGFASDLRIAFDAEVTAGAGDLHVALDGGGRACELRIGEDGWEVKDPGGTWKPDLPALSKLGSRFRVGFSMADRIVRVELGDRIVASREHADVTNGGLDTGRARIGARGVALTVRGLVGEDDVQYTDTGVTTWDVPADGYVMLGDNTHSSQDSRVWEAYVVRTKSGREFVAPASARLREDSHPETTWFPQQDGSVQFVDSYGVRRHVPAEDLAAPPRLERQPFARESDLVGRAFFIFYPFPPFGDFRPRLLR